MGMSASQARFLALTAKKSNIEYQGQQINQSRTILANQSSNLFNKMLQISVPTAPNKASYTKVSYNFNDGNKNVTITDTKVSTNGENYLFNIDNKQESLTFKTGSLNKAEVTFADGSTGNFSLLDKQQDNYPKVDGMKVVSYQKGNETYYTYLPEEDWQALKDDKAFIAWGSTTKTYGNASVYSSANVSKSTNGQINSVSFNGNVYGGATYNLTPTTYTDEEAYEAAYNKYLYDQANYEKLTNDINAQTEALQQEDRTLELQLKQLDTEHNAIQTEIDTVQKVVQKNVETSFKTFG